MSSYFLFFVGKYHIEYALRPKQEVENQINSKLTSKTQKQKPIFLKIKISQIFQVFLQFRKENYA